MANELTPNERARIRARSGCDDATIKRFARGDRVTDATAMRIQRAAAEEGIILSPPTPGDG